MSHNPDNLIEERIKIFKFTIANCEIAVPEHWKGFRDCKGLDGRFQGRESFWRLAGGKSYSRT